MEEQKSKEIISEKEKKEKEPKISLSFFFSPHATGKDFEKLGELFRRADVYIPEFADWSPELLDDYQKLSRGEITPKEICEKHEYESNSANEKEAEFIYQSQKPIFFVDIGKSQHLERAEKYYTEIRPYLTKAIQFFQEGDLEQAVKDFHTFYQLHTELESRREDIIKANLEKKLKELTVLCPELKNKDEIKVLIAFGAFHTKIYHSLAKKYPSLRQFSRTLFVYSSLDQVERSMVFSKDVSKELLARQFPEARLCNFFDSITSDSQKIIEIARKISSQLSFEDIKKMSAEWKFKNLDIRENFIKYLENLGIKVPKSEEEMDEMIKGEH